VARCQNLSCPAQVKGRIAHFISKPALDIDGFGGKLVDQLVEKELIQTVDDIFKLTFDDLVNLERMADKSAKNIVTAINNAKHTIFSRFIYALGIRNVGIHLSKVLEKSFSGDINAFMSTSAETLKSINEVGPIVAKTIETFWSNSTNVNVVNSCLSLGVVLENVAGPKSRILAGKTIVFSGKLTQFSRNEAKDLAETHGGRISNAVSNNTDFLVAGPRAGSKLKKAEAMDIKILNEEEFLTIILNED
jgi:DNA ligase (NAD+)